MIEFEIDRVIDSEVVNVALHREVRRPLRRGRCQDPRAGAVDGVCKTFVTSTDRHLKTCAVGLPMLMDDNGCDSPEHGHARLRALAPGLFGFIDNFAHLHGVTTLMIDL